MKKALVLTVFVISIFISNGQIIIESDEFAQYGSYFVDAQDTLSLGIIDPGTEGENNWDFSFVEGYTVDTLYILDPQDVSESDSFPLSNYVGKMVNIVDSMTGYLFMKISPDSLSMLGAVMYMGDLVAVLKNYPCKISVILPATYNPTEVFINEYSSSMKIKFNDTTFVEKKSYIFDTLVVDAYGMLDLPDFSDIPVL